MALTRELVVTYGAYEISTATGRDLDGKILIERGWDAGSVEFSFMLSGATDAAFATACSAAEVAFRKPYQSLSIKQGGQTLQSVSQTTAIDPMPRIIKREDVGDTGRSRRYTVIIEFGLPATTGGEEYNGLRELSVNVSYNEARVRTITISGTVTASGATGAFDQYESIIDSIESDVFGASQLNITTANRELVGEPTINRDTNDKLCEFTRAWEELIHSQGGESNNDTGIVKQRYNVTRSRDWPGDTPKTSERLAYINLSYEAWVDSEVSTDLKAKYESIRSWLVDQMSTVADGKAVHVTNKTFTPHHDENRFTVEMTGIAQIVKGVIVEQRVTISDDDQKGQEIVPAWSGDNLAAYWYPGPRIVIRTVTHTLKVAGKMLTEQDALGFARDQVNTAKGRPPAGGNGGTWLLVRQQPGATQLKLGSRDDGSKELDITEMSITSQLRYVVEPGGGQTRGHRSTGGGDYQRDIIESRPEGAFSG